MKERILQISASRLRERSASPLLENLKNMTLMTGTFPHHKPRKPMCVVQASIFILLLLSPVFLKFHFERMAKIEIASEYETSRPVILSRINHALENCDLETLLHIHGKYADRVSDGNFKAVINDAVAKASARQAVVELAISKHLDVTRNEEAVRQYPRQPQLAQENNKAAEQRLSVLPK